MKDCEMIKELLPMYIEGDCPDKLKQFMETHLGSCPECQKEYEAMTAEIAPLPVILPEAEQINSFKKIKKRNRRNIAVILSLAVFFLAATVGIVKYLDFKNGKTVYCQRNPVVVFEAIIDSLSRSGQGAGISIVLAEKEGNIYDYKNHFFEIYHEGKNQYYRVKGETMALFGSFCVRLVPESKKGETPDLFDLLTAVTIIKSVLAKETMDEGKMAITMYSCNGAIKSEMNYYYDAINNTFVTADEFAERQDGHGVCLIQLVEPKVEIPNNGVLMGEDLETIKIAVFY